MSSGKRDGPNEPTLFLARPPFRKFAVTVLLVCSWLFLRCLRSSDNAIPFYTGSSESSASAEDLCVQPNALIPEQNLFFWTSIGDALKTEAVKMRVVNWLGGAVRVATETFDDMGAVGEDPRWENRADFHEYLLRAFPLVHSNLLLTKVNTYGLLYTWKGYDATLKPSLMAAHQDVVPVNPDTVDEWAHPPYSGHFDGEYIWGRGSSDDKSGLCGILSAIELLLEMGFQPARTVILPFGFDEEGGGRQGAGELGKYLLDVYGKDSFAFVIDEGGGFMEQFGSAFATPGIAEKGSMNVQIEVATPGGHSSVPPSHTSIGILSALLVHIEENPFEVHINRATPIYELLQCFAAHGRDVPDSLREAIKRSAKSDKYLKQVEKQLFKNNVYKSLAGTTQAIDIIGGGVKSNALPEQAYAIVNHRINTESSGNATKEHDRELLKPLAENFNLTYVAFGEQVSEKDVPHQGRLTLSAPHQLEPAPVTPTKGPNSLPYKLLSGSIKAAYNAHRSLMGENIAVGPGMPTGNTDTRFYWDLTEHIFRYNHHNSGSGSNPLKGAHTVNESISIDNLLEMIRFFATLILNADETVEF